MVMQTESIVLMSAMWRTDLEVVFMNEEQFQREKMYFATMHIAKNLFHLGIMTAEEYSQIDTIFRDKYQPNLFSLQIKMSGYQPNTMALYAPDKEG